MARKYLILKLVLLLALSWLFRRGFFIFGVQRRSFGLYRRIFPMQARL
jgi:hypothetical protein